MGVVFKIIMICYILLITILLSSLPCWLLETINIWNERKLKNKIYICTFVISFLICVGGYMYLYFHPVVKYENTNETLTEVNEQSMITKWHWNKTLPIFASQYYVYDVYDGKYYTVDVSYLFVSEICTYSYAPDGYAIIYNGFDF